MTAQGYGLPGAQGRKRKTWIVVPVNDVATRGEARKAWDAGEPFRMQTSEGLGRQVTKTTAQAFGVVEVTIRFGAQSVRATV